MANKTANEIAGKTAKKTGALEGLLRELLIYDAPELPKTVKRVVASWLPIVSLVAGMLALLTAWSLWRWARATDIALNSVCNMATVSGCGNPSNSRFSMGVLLGLAAAGIVGVLCLVAGIGLLARKRTGWKCLYYAAVLNLVYGLTSLLGGYSKTERFVVAVACSLIGFYALFQVRELYVRPGGASKVENSIE